MTAGDVGGATVVFLAAIVVLLLADWVDWRWLARWARWRLARPAPDFRAGSEFLSQLYFWEQRRPTR